MIFKKPKFVKILFLFSILIPGFIFYFLFRDKKSAEISFENKNKNIIIVDDGMRQETKNVSEDFVKDFINGKKIAIKENDYVFPPVDSKIYDNSVIIIKRNKKVFVSVDGKKIEGNTLGNSVAAALYDIDIELGEDDFSIPSVESSIKDKTKIEVVRVDIKEETVKKDVDFEKKTTEDDKLSWRTKKVSQKGAKGVDEYKYKVISHNGKEISRKLLSKERTKDPVPEISVQGTYMKLGKANSGQGTWYAYKGGLFAASLAIPRGGYAKVTNKDNGKTVVVQINDSGPYGKGRIIDLDKVAFEKIADLGAGVVNVKVEQVLN